MYLRHTEANQGLTSKHLPCVPQKGLLFITNIFHCGAFHL